MIKLPLTREDFESQVAMCAHIAEVPFNDDTRIAAVNYFHSLDRFESDFDQEFLAAYLRKAFSSKLTFDIVQEIDHKRRAEQAAAQPEHKPDLSIVEPTEPLTQ